MKTGTPACANPSASSAQGYGLSGAGRPRDQAVAIGHRQQQLNVVLSFSDQNRLSHVRQPRVVMNDTRPGSRLGHVGRGRVGLAIKSREHPTCSRNLLVLHAA